MAWTTAEPLVAVGEALDRLERGWYFAVRQDGYSYPYMPLPLVDFLAGLEAARAAAKGRRYLEVGCGIGTKLAIAALLGLDAHGIDWDERYVAIARHLCPEATIEVADARAYEYGAFDVVYSYRPFVDEAAQIELERHLADSMRPGSVLFAPLRELAGDWREVARYVGIRS